MINFLLLLFFDLSQKFLKYCLILKIYSYFKALIGSSLAAFKAGNIETTIVLIIEQIDIIKIELGLISEGILLKK